MVFSLFALILLSVSFSKAGADTLYGVGFEQPSQLEPLGDLGLQLRYVGPGIAFVTGEEGVRPELPGLSIVLTDRATPDETYFLVNDLSRPLHPDVTLVFAGEDERWALIRFPRARFGEVFESQYFLRPLPEIYSLQGLLTRPSRARPVASLEALAVDDLIAQVEGDLVRGHVRSLALIDTALGSVLDNLRTRFALRSETYEATIYIRDHLAASLGEQSVQVQDFVLEAGDLAARASGLTDDDDLTMYNVIGEVQGTDPEAGYYVVCAHYDAIGVRTPGDWDWRTGAAPGADDNATGVAVVLEAARVLSQVNVPWSIRFILWSGEELGTLGSRHYASQALDREDRILGVYNIDMVGYNDLRPRMELVTNPASRWLVDLMVQANELHGIGMQLDVLEDPYATLSDHGPFWARGYDAILGIENYLPNDTTSAGIVSGHYRPYTAYHSVADVPDSVNWELVTRITRLTVATLGQLVEGDGLPNLAVFAGDVSGGRQDDLRVRISNTGRATLAEPYRLLVSRCSADSSDCVVIHDEEQHGPLAPGAVEDITFGWQRYGDTVFLVELDPDERIEESSEVDNRVFDAVRLVPRDRIVVYPNPYRAGHHPFLSFNGVPTFSEVRIYTLAGEAVWTGFERDSGLNQLREIRWLGTSDRGWPVASGIYLYTVTSPDGVLLRRDRIALTR